MTKKQALEELYNVRAILIYLHVNAPLQEGHKQMLDGAIQKCVDITKTYYK